MIGSQILLATVIGAFAAGTGLYAIWSYRHDSYFRNDVKREIFTVTTKGRNRKLLLLGDSRIELLECAQYFAGWATLNLGVGEMTSDRLAEFVVSRRNALTSFDAIVLWIGGNDIFRGRSVADASNDILSILRELGRLTTPIALLEQIHVVNSANQVRLERANVKLMKLNGTLADASDGARITILKPFGTSRSIHNRRSILTVFISMTKEIRLSATLSTNGLPLYDRHSNNHADQVSLVCEAEPVAEYEAFQSEGSVRHHP